MTREEAIWYLQPIADSASLPRYAEALNMAIAALRERDALLAEIKGMCHLCRNYNLGNGGEMCINCRDDGNFEWRGTQAVTDGHHLETVTNCNGFNRTESEAIKVVDSDQFKPGWISVEDRLPEEWREVLVWSMFGFVEVAVWLGTPGRWRVNWNHDRLEDNTVTHWMPLPEPPEVQS